MQFLWYFKLAVLGHSSLFEGSRYCIKVCIVLISLTLYDRQHCSQHTKLWFQVTSDSLVMLIILLNELLVKGLRYNVAIEINGTNISFLIVILPEMKILREVLV